MKICTTDFDECTDWYGHASDCSELAWCINTKGSYMCSCFSEYEDQSLDPNSKPGRICKRRYFCMFSYRYHINQKASIHYVVFEYPM